MKITFMFLIMALSSIGLASPDEICPPEGSEIAETVTASDGDASTTADSDEMDEGFAAPDSPAASPGSPALPPHAHWMLVAPPALLPAAAAAAAAASATGSPVVTPLYGRTNSGMSPPLEEGRRRRVLRRQNACGNLLPRILFKKDDHDHDHNQGGGPRRSARIAARAAAHTGSGY